MARLLSLILLVLCLPDLALAAPRLLVLVGESEIQQALGTELALDASSLDTQVLDQPPDFETWSTVEQQDHVRVVAGQAQALVVAWLSPDPWTLFLWAPGEGRDLIVAVQAETAEPAAELALVARSHVLKLAQEAASATARPVEEPEGAEDEQEPDPPAGPTRWWAWSGFSASGGGTPRVGGHIGLGVGARAQVRLQLGSHQGLGDTGGLEWDGATSLWLHQPAGRFAYGAGMGFHMRHRVADLASPDMPLERYRWWRPAAYLGAEIGYGVQARLAPFGELTLGDRSRIWATPAGLQVLVDPWAQWSAGMRLTVPID